MTITLKELAKKAGVHESTVSRALAGSNLVNDETKKGILKIAQRYNYRPNALAQGLSRKKTNMIGLIVPDFMSSFYPQIIQGVEDCCVSKQYRLIFGKSDFDYEKERYYLNSFCEWRVDGIILCTFQIKKNLSYLEEIKRSKTPIVFVETYHDYTLEDYHIVQVDNHYGGYLATDYLIKSGHKDIAFLTDHVTTEERYLGYRSALKENRIKFNPKLVRKTKIRHEAGGYKACKELLSRNIKFSALFAVNDLMAIGAMRALGESGHKIPKDISVVGYDDITVSSYMDVSLTTICQAKEDLGRIGAEVLLSSIENPTSSYPHNIELKPKLVVRESTRKIR